MKRYRNLSAIGGPTEGPKPDLEARFDRTLLQDGACSTITITITLPEKLEDDYMTSRDSMIYHMMQDSALVKFPGSGMLLVNPNKVFRPNDVLPDKAVLRPTMERSKLTEKIMRRNRRRHV